jgi:hypothetical protein
MDEPSPSLSPPFPFPLFFASSLPCFFASWRDLPQPTFQVELEVEVEVEV